MSGARSPTGAEGSVEWVEERLDSLSHSISHDVLTGLEREITKIRGWLAMLEVRHGESEEVVIKKLQLRNKYNQLETAMHVFKTALGSLYTPPAARRDPFGSVLRADST